MKDTPYQDASEVERLDHDFLAALGLISSEQMKNTQVGLWQVHLGQKIRTFQSLTCIATVTYIAEIIF